MLYIMLAVHIIQRFRKANRYLYNQKKDCNCHHPSSLLDVTTADAILSFDKALWVSATLAMRY